tara:strand:+ start:542 stop:1735 length:1194 start_codon:yes stop_codon:yes gene_type:complete
MEYNPQEARKKTSPEQQMIREARNLEYDRKFKKSAEERLNQDNPTPLGVFKVQARDVARKIVNKANELVIEKDKGEISNEDFAANMAMTEQMVGNLGKFTTTVEANLASYNDMLKNGQLSYGMDQHEEAVLQAIDKGEVKLDLDKEGRVILEGKGNHAIKGGFDVSIYDFFNVPKPVKKIPPINNLLDPYINNLGLDENGMPKTKTNENGELVYDSGEYGDHSREVLGFTIDALKAAGPSGIRSFLGDHLNIPNEEIKALAEDVNYIDEEGQEFDDGAQARAFKDLNGYMEGRYTRQMRPHPDTIARNAQTSAAQIAAKKQVMLPGQEEVQAQQTEVMQTPQGTIAETVTEDATIPNAAANMYEPQVEVQDTVEETVEETPIKMKSSSAKDLIKKYS